MARSLVFIFGVIVTEGKLTVYWIMGLALFLSRLSQEKQLTSVFSMVLNIGAASLRLIPKMDTRFMVEPRSSQDLLGML